MKCAGLVVSGPLLPKVTLVGDKVALGPESPPPRFKELRRHGGIGGRTIQGGFAEAFMVFTATRARNGTPVSDAYGLHRRSWRTG